MKSRKFKGTLFVALFLTFVVASSNLALATGPTLPVVSYGIISSSGTEISGYGISSISKVSTGRYEITFTNFDYYYRDHIAVANAISTGCYNITTNSMNAERLVIFIKDDDGNAVDAMFSFVVYEPGD